MQITNNQDFIEILNLIENSKNEVYKKVSTPLTQITCNNHLERLSSKTLSTAERNNEVNTK